MLIFNIKVVALCLQHMLLSAHVCPGNPEERERYSSRPDAIMLLPAKSCSARPTTAIGTFPRSKRKPPYPEWEVHSIQFKHCEDTRPQNQQRIAEEQHTAFIDLLSRRGYKKVKLHVILTGAMGSQLHNKAIRNFGGIAMSLTHLIKSNQNKSLMMMTLD